MLAAKHSSYKKKGVDEEDIHVDCFFFFTLCEMWAEYCRHVAWHPSLWLVLKFTFCCRDSWVDYLAHPSTELTEPIKTSFELGLLRGYGWGISLCFKISENVNDLFLEFYKVSMKLQGGEAGSPRCSQNGPGTLLFLIWGSSSSLWRLRFYGTTPHHPPSFHTEGTWELQTVS